MYEEATATGKPTAVHTYPAMGVVYPQVGQRQHRRTKSLCASYTPNSSTHEEAAATDEVTP